MWSNTNILFVILGAVEPFHEPRLARRIFCFLTVAPLTAAPQIKSKKVGQVEREERRPLGFIMVRGENIVSITIEGPPPADVRPLFTSIAETPSSRTRLMYFLYRRSV